MISVIIPVYNAAPYLKTSVESVLKQKEVKQILLIEDCSTDNSLNICISLKNTFPDIITLLIHPEKRNMGAGASRNLGILNATQQYIAFLDADDFYLNERFKNDIKILESQHEVDGVYNALGCHIYDSSENHRITNKLTTLIKTVPPACLFEEMSPIGKAGHFSCNTLTVRKNIFDTVGLFDTSLELTQDTHMWIKMAALTNLHPGIIDKPVAIRGVHQNNRIKNKSKLLSTRPKLYLKLIHWARSHNICHSRKSLLLHSYLKSMKALYRYNEFSFLHFHYKYFKNIISLFFTFPITFMYLFLSLLKRKVAS